MAFLREDYVAFLDESGDEDITVVSGLFVPTRWMRSAATFLDDIRATEGFTQPEEMKAAELATGRGFAWERAQSLVRPPGVSFRNHAKQTGCDIYKRVLRQVSRINGLRVLTVGLPTNVPNEVYRLWFWTLCAGLTSFPRGRRRPQVSMLVIDGQDQGLLRIHRGVVKDFYTSCRGRQPYISAGRAWFIGGAVLHESHSLPFIQATDLNAHAAFQALRANPDRAYMHQWYENEFRAPARRRRRLIDVSDFCLAELRACAVPPEMAPSIAVAMTVP
jgi:hypothetical protein